MNIDATYFIIFPASLPTDVRMNKSTIMIDRLLPGILAVLEAML